MKCYVCAKQGVDEEAVAICIICGMGLCLGHAFKEELKKNWRSGISSIRDLEKKRLPIRIPFHGSSAPNASLQMNREKR